MLNHEKTETMEELNEHQAREAQAASDAEHTEETASAPDGQQSVETAAEKNDSAANASEQMDELTEQLNELQAKWEASEKQVEELQQKLLRAHADFDNFRRRTRAEKEELQKYASIRVLENLLPVIDNFERALAASEDNQDFDALFKGLKMTYSQLMQVTEQEELRPIKAVGEPFNPEFHQAVMQVESDEHEEGIVVEELQKGYTLKDKVLRPAMVKVSK